MTFEEAMQDAARRADEAVISVMRRYKNGDVTDEPEITGELMGQLVARMEGKSPGGITWTGNIVRNQKGRGAEENKTGADLLMHVRVDTPKMTYSKGVLVQAKRVEPTAVIGTTELSKLRRQCDKMLGISAASFVFDYAKGSMRVGPATRFSGTRDGRIFRQCTWTSYRFFLELFRCPVGDPRIRSARVKNLPVPNVIYLHGEGEVQI